MSGYLTWRGAELDPTVWQGIEFLSIGPVVPGFATAVIVHLARPASGLSAADVQVTGGRSIILDDPEIIIINGSQTFQVRFVAKGDHSPYTIRLLNGGDDPLHPFFAEAQLSFFIDCETGDCRLSTLAATSEPSQPPSIDARYKDFRGFMRMLAEWVRVANPDWADLAPASQERMLMELLAYQGDMLSYYQDRIANEAFLATASQRHSLRQHATLLGYPVFEGEAAQALLAFETTAAGFVPEGLSVENKRSHGERPVVFHVRERTPVDPANNSSALTIAAWPGAATATIPAGTTKLLLWDQAYTLLPGMPFAFVQGDFSQVVNLTAIRLLDLPGWVADPNDPLAPVDQPLTEIQFDNPLERELRPWSTTDRLRLYANVARARHGAHRVSWVNPTTLPAPGDPVPSQDDIILPLNRRNSIVVAVPRGGVLVSQLRAFEVPEGPVIHERDEKGLSVPVIDVYVDGELWAREEHLHQSQSFDSHYVAGTDNSGNLWIEFGDGVRGREIEVDPATGRPLVTIRLSYRIAEPLDGNCARDTLTEVVQPTEAGFTGLGVTAITNVTPGAGGRRKDTLDEIREGVPVSLRHGELQRAVSLEDYAEIARSVAGVSRAAAKSLGGPFNTVLVLIDADNQATLTAELRDRVWQRIEETRMAGREHFVAAAEYVPIRVELIICVQPGFLRHEVRDRVLAQLRPGNRKQPGFFNPDNLTFGQDIESGELIAFVQSIHGVRSVKVTAFCRLDAPAITVEDRLFFGPTEVARLDADEDFPENGILRVSVVGLDQVDETIFDIETSGGEV